MVDIFHLTPNKTSWRDDWLPAMYNGAPFFCEANSRESGRRIVQHQFPKKESPYAEDMGREAREFTIRAYCIVFVRDADDLYRRDYRKVRDKLIAALEQEGVGELQLSTQLPQQVVVHKYRMSEEERFGGFCTFEITFLEAGLDPLYDPGEEDTENTTNEAAQEVRNQVQRSLAPPNPSIGTGVISA